MAGVGVEYQRWTRVNPIPAFSPAKEILGNYAPELESYKRKKNLTACEVVDLTPETPGLERMLTGFKREHRHKSDEARFILAGRGVCYVHPASMDVIAVELEPGDLLSVGPGIRHWFELCAERRFRAIQFSAEGECTEYTTSGIEADYEPLCMGPAYLPSRAFRTARPLRRIA